MSGGYRVHLMVKAGWGPRQETAGEIATKLQHWLRCIATLDYFSNLVIKRRKQTRPVTAEPSRFMEIVEILPLLRGVGNEKPAREHSEIDSISFAATLVEAGTTGDNGFTVFLNCGSKSELTGNGYSIAFPDLVKPTVTRAWKNTVIETLVEAFDPDEVRFEADHTTFTPQGRAVGNPRYWLRWDRGRRPLDPPLDEPTPPKLNRPWLGGTLYEWPEHAALFGATSELNEDQLPASTPDQRP